MANVVFIVNSLRYKSGMERVACILANSFVNTGYNVTIINRDTVKESVAYSLNDRVVVHAFGGSYLKFFINLRNYLYEKKPDFIVVHNMGRLSLLCSFLNIAENSQLVSLEHVAFSSRPKWVQALYKIRSNKFNKIIALTEHDAKAYKVFHKDVVVINNSSPFHLDSIDHSYPKESKKVVAVGRLTYQKNFQSLLTAWNIVSQKNSEWKLEIYGTGEDYNQLREIITSQSIKNVELLGQVDNVGEVYSKAALYVMSSRFEGLPMVLIEAQTFGLPIVSYDCPFGPSEIVENGVNGFLVDNQNNEKLAEALLILIENLHLREKMAEEAKKHARKYSNGFILKQWQTLVFDK